MSIILEDIHNMDFQWLESRGMVGGLFEYLHCMQRFTIWINSDHAGLICTRFMSSNHVTIGR